MTASVSSIESDSAASTSPPSSVDGHAAGDGVKQTRQGKDWRPVSTYHLKKYKDQTLAEKIVMRGIMSTEYHTLKPQTLERGPIPYHSTLREHVYILSRGAIPLVVQALSYHFYPNSPWPTWAAYPFYFLCFTKFAIATVKRFDRFAGIYGTLDERECGRDRVPNIAAPQLAMSFLYFLIGRTAGEFLLRWDKTESPINAFSWTTPMRMFTWLIVMDYFFYVYHRSCHEISALWSVHQRHHQTKHPSPLLSILADGKQEVLEIALVPLCASLLVPMNFHELYLMIVYTTYVEIFGHTGIRADWALPITGPILRFIGCELIIEDHDLHHRHGKSGRNYGKQSRVWDVLFNTTTPREEMKDLPGHRAL